MATTTLTNRIATGARRGTDAYRDEYFKLCSGLGYLPAPIRTAADARAAGAVVDALAPRGEDSLTEAEADYLEVVSDLVEEHERPARDALAAAAGDAIDVLRSILDDHGMTASDLGHLLGNRSLGGKLLRRERSLSKAHMLALGRHFAVEPGLFLRE